MVSVNESGFWRGDSLVVAGIHTYKVPHFNHLRWWYAWYLRVYLWYVIPVSICDTLDAMMHWSFLSLFHSKRVGICFCFPYLLHYIPVLSVRCTRLHIIRILLRFFDDRDSYAVLVRQSAIILCILVSLWHYTLHCLYTRNHDEYLHYSIFPDKTNVYYCGWPTQRLASYSRLHWGPTLGLPWMHLISFCSLDVHDSVLSSLVPCTDRETVDQESSWLIKSTTRVMMCLKVR